MNGATRLWRLVGIFILAFLAGELNASFGTFPYPYLRDAGRTLDALMTEWAMRWSPVWNVVGQATSIPLQDIQGGRWTAYDKSPPALPILVTGGHSQFLEYCPEHGCLAVSFDANRRLMHAWPFRPREIFSQDMTKGDYPHEKVVFDPVKNVFPVGVERYENGDLLATFQARSGGIFPFGMGIARIAPDGHPRWVRFDYSHHWSYLGRDGIAYVPSLRIGDKSLSFTDGPETASWTFDLPCQTGHPQLDVVQKVDGEGRVLETIDLVSVLLNSHWAAAMVVGPDYCDPLHLNFVSVVGDDVSDGLTPGDLVVSLHNISRFAVIDARTHQIKRMVAGSFIQQHSVQHLAGSRFLIFDNVGGGPLGPPSRILEMDIATGRERRIFPNPDTPAQFRDALSRWYGHLTISPDRRRIFASFTYMGQAFEIDIESGRLISVYDNLHDVSSVPGVEQAATSHAMRFWTLGMSYLTP